MSKDLEFSRCILVCALVGAVFWACLFKVLL